MPTAAEREFFDWLASYGGGLLQEMIRGGTMSKVDPSIYKLAGEYADYVRAFAIHESHEDKRAFGDGGRAYGLLQMHPATFKRYYGAVEKRWPAVVTDTWTVAFIKACASFLHMHQFLDLADTQRALIVQAWKLGDTGVFIDGERNPDYLEKWTLALNQIHGEKA